MGFSFRKSFKAGPIRVNLSKKGIGVSAGVKGLRVGTGPSGTRVSAGKGPLRYTKQAKGGCMLTIAALMVPWAILAVLLILCQLVPNW